MNRMVRLTIATILGIITFILIFTLVTYLSYPTKKGKLEELVDNTPVVFNEYKVALVVIEVETIEDVTKLYKMRYGDNLNPEKIILGFAEYTQTKPIKCLIVVPFAFRDNGYKNELNIRFSIAGHELNHCIRGQFHLEDNAIKVITF